MRLKIFLALSSELVRQFYILVQPHDFSANRRCTLHFFFSVRSVVDALGCGLAGSVKTYQFAFYGCLETSTFWT